MYRRELTVRGDSEPYNGVCNGPACLSVVDNLAALRREVLRIMVVSPIYGHDYLPMGHQALVVCGKAGVGAEQGAAACHVGSLETLSDLRLYTLVDPVDLSKSSNMIFLLDRLEDEASLLFPQTIKRCRICGMPLGSQSYWSFEAEGELVPGFRVIPPVTVGVQACVPCYERTQDMARDLADRKWSFHGSVR